MKKHSYQLNIGGASILLLLVVFAMTVFAVLSMRASYHEVKMSEKTRDSVENYYLADAKTEEILMYISNVMKEANNQLDVAVVDYFKNEISSKEELTFDETTGILTCVVPVDYNKNLETNIIISKDSARDYEVVSSKMIVHEMQDYDNDLLEIWDGVIDE